MLQKGTIVLKCLLVITVLGCTMFSKASLPIEAQTSEACYYLDRIEENNFEKPIVYEAKSGRYEGCMDVRDYGYHRYQQRAYPPVIIDEYDGPKYHYTVYSQVIECVCGKQQTIVYTVRS